MITSQPSRNDARVQFGLPTSTTAWSAGLLLEAILDAAERVPIADLGSVDAANAPVELPQSATVDLLAFWACQTQFTGSDNFARIYLGTSGTHLGQIGLLQRTTRWG